MNKFYFSAKIQQEYSDIIREKVLSLGVPQENIVLKREGFKLLYMGIYIKFDNKDIYERFISLQLPGIVETW